MPEDQDRISISVIIVNYRTKELTLDAIRSCLGDPIVREVIVVDNASGDDSIVFMKAELCSPLVKFIDSSVNLGFGRAVNLAVPAAASELILLLNSDATIAIGSVATLVDTLVASEFIGVVAPAVYEADGLTLQPGAYGSFPSLFSSPFGFRVDSNALSPDWVSGVAMMMRKRDFLAVGGFDVAFDMYLEDVDFCRRLRDQGKVVQREVGAAVTHLGGRSWASSVVKRDQYQRSKLTYFRKQGLGRSGLAMLQVLRLMRVAGAQARQRFGRSRSNLRSL